ncbi:MAG: hypothetical protein JNK79_01380 [Chitinophagaceae bacterium]|nr:hypothetical protein [Chitinophagaceae bacterium]
MSETLESYSAPAAQIHSPIVRWLAKIVSFVFHPLFIPVFVTLFLLYAHPIMFAGYSDVMKYRLTATIFVNLAMLPAITVLLCWRLNFVDSIYMNTQKERIIPLAAAMIFYFWGWFVLKNNSGIPDIFKEFLLGCFITIIAGWLSNIAFKVSLHGLAMGGMFCFILLLTFRSEGLGAQYVAFAALVAGLVCSMRLVLNTHRPFEVYFGFLLGALSQVVALVL